MIALSALAVAPFLTAGAVEGTSVPGFCRSCHEIEPAYQSWSRSQHAAVDGKTRATCRDCHVPSWRHPLDAIVVKVTHGTRDLVGHVHVDEKLQAKDFYFAMKYRAREAFADEVCLECHADIRSPGKDVIQTAEGELRGLHQAEDSRRVRCLVCHKNAGHGVYR